MGRLILEYPEKLAAIRSFQRAEKKILVELTALEDGSHRLKLRSEHDECVFVLSSEEMRWLYAEFPDAVGFLDIVSQWKPRRRLSEE